jgi:hypothetical protein
MRMINHAMTGALIGLAVGEPAVAVPIALASHFVLDAIPHHDSAKPDSEYLRSKWFTTVLVIDILLCILLVLILAARQPLHWQLAAICAFVAASPDMLFIDRYIKALRHQSVRLSRFVQWTRDIQWFARPIGAVVEAAWFAGAAVLLSSLI